MGDHHARLIHIKLSASEIHVAEQSSRHALKFEHIWALGCGACMGSRVTNASRNEKGQFTRLSLSVWPAE